MQGKATTRFVCATDSTSRNWRLVMRSEACAVCLCRKESREVTEKRLVELCLVYGLPLERKLPPMKEPPDAARCRACTVGLSGVDSCSSDTWLSCDCSFGSASSSGDPLLESASWYRATKSPPVSGKATALEMAGVVSTVSACVCTVGDDSRRVGVPVEGCSHVCNGPLRELFTAHHMVSRLLRVDGTHGTLFKVWCTAADAAISMCCSLLVVLCLAVRFQMEKETEAS